MTRNFIRGLAICFVILLTLAVAQPQASAQRPASGQAPDSGQAPAGQTINPASGKAMCSALTPADFTKTGVPVSRLSQANLDDNRSAYCIYDGKAGKIEFDIFYPAADTPSAAQNAERAAQAAIGGKFESVRVAGADEATTNAASPKGNDASIVVRKGTTVFNLSIPHGGQAHQQLITLSEIVVSRLKQ